MDLDNCASMDKLHLFWSAFTDCDNEKIKVKWLELFLYEYNNKLIETADINFHKRYGFLATVPSELTCYTLQLVYAIICASVSPSTTNDSPIELVSNDNISHSSVNLSNAKVISYANGVSDMITDIAIENDRKTSVAKANDITTIVALREFLVNGIGGKILELLLNIDTKNLLCARELISLLVNLFPTGPWDNIQSNIEPKENIYDFVSLAASIQKLEAIKLSPNFEKSVSNEMSLASSCCDVYTENGLPELLQSANPPNIYQTDDFRRFIMESYTCDHIGSIVINLIMKLMSEENNGNIDKRSITVQCLQFSVENYCDIRQSKAFSRINREKLQRKLLALLCMSFSNIFSGNRRFDEVIDIATILRRLLETLEDDVCDETDVPMPDELLNIRLEHISTLVYAIFLILQFVFKSTEDLLHIFLNLFNLLKSHSETLLNVLQNLMLFRKHLDDCILLKLTESVCRLIYVIRRIDYIFNPMKQRSRRKRIQRFTVCTHHHQATDELGCILENILLKIAQQQVDSTSVIRILTFFRKNPICCCNSDLKTMEILLINSKMNRVQKNGLNFIKNNFLKNIYSNIECRGCDTKRIAEDIGSRFVQFYSSYVQSLDSQELTVFLKHIIKISKYLPFDVAFKIFVDVVFPPFRLEKSKIMLGCAKEKEVQRSKDIIVCCLNIFLCYLKDLRLIKGFYNAENLQHLSDLIVVPEFASLVCCILKIGLENLSFLGENSEEQEMLSEKLHELQTNTLANISEVLMWLFKDISTVASFQLKLDVERENTGVKNNSTNILLEFIKAKQLSIQNILHLSVVYWNLILQLFRTNAQLRASLQQSIVVNHSNIVFQLVYNSLSCYLYMKKETTAKTTTQQLDNSLLEEQFLVRINEFCLLNKNTTVLANKCLNPFSTDDIFLQDFNGSTFEIFDRNRAGILNICDDFNFSDIIQTEENDLSVKSGVNFADRNTIAPATTTIHLRTKNSNNLIKENCVENIVDNQHSTESNLISISLQKIQQFIGIGNVYDIFFTKSDSANKNSEVTDVQREPQIFSKNELILFETLEYKKLFLQLFEITCGVMMSENHQEACDTTLSSSLKELKLLLTRHSLTITDSNESGTLIINALQSLLKVAEMRYNCCFIEKCSHSSYARRSRFALNASIDGSYQCCGSSTKSLDRNDISSEVDHSEGDTTSDETYLTADEGYDGDAEHASIIDSDIDETIVNRSIIPAISQYRSHIIHDGICRIVINILIDLSRQCIQDPYFWPNYLMQIATRFTAIRESIGGSLHLIKGFAPILETNDIRLRDFQKSILELITDISTPESLSAYLSIMTSDNAPIDLLLPRLVYLGAFSFRIQPSFEIEFPTNNDESMKTTCDPLLVKDIKQIHDYHEYHNLRTPFTQSSYIIPLNYINFNPWNQNGFTLSTWIKFKPVVVRDQVSEELHSSEYEDESSKQKCSSHVLTDMTHLFSIGTNKLLLSIYVNYQDSNGLYFQLSKPCAQLIEQKQQNMSRSNADVFNVPSVTKPKNSCGCLFRRKRKTFSNIVPYNKEINISNNTKEKSTINVEDTDECTTTQSGSKNQKQPIKTAKHLFKNSFSQLNIFSSVSSDVDSDLDTNKYPLEYKKIKLPKNKWTNLVFSIGFNTSKDLAIRITIDGFDQHNIVMACPPIDKKDKFQLLCIGQNQKTPLSQDAYERNNCYDQTISYSLANVLVFEKCLTNPTMLANLTAMGPDCINFIQSQVNSVIPNIGFLNQQTFVNDIQLSTSAILDMLQDNLVAAYSAHNPNILMGYTKSQGYGSGETMGLITLGCEAEIKYVKSLQSAVILSGGLSVLLYLFARVVELSNSDFIQSLALSFLLRTAHSNSILYTEFIRKDYINLIGLIIRSNKCIKRLHLLNSILETACDMPLLTARADRFVVIPTTQACIIYPNLLMSVINQYSDWHKDSNNDSEVLDILLGSIQALVREKHSKQSINIMRLTAAGIIPTLLNFCKIYLIGVSQPVFISNRAADSLVGLISTFAGAPPSSLLLDDVIKVLLLLHRPSDSYITHDRSKYYFLLSSMVMVKQKKLSLSMASRNPSSSIKRERKSSTPSKFQLSKVQRSISLDNSRLPIEIDDRRFFFKRKMRSHDDDKVMHRNENGESAELKSSCREVDEVDHNEINSPSPISFSQSNIFQGTVSSIADQTLESIADCSRLNGSVLRLFNSTSPSKLDKALYNIKIRRQSVSRKRIHKRGRTRSKTRSLRSSATDTDTDRESLRISSVSESGIEEDMVQDFVIIASDDVKRIEETVRMRSSMGTREFDFRIGFDGVVQTQIGFFNLLKDFILILPDSSIQEVLTHYVTFDIILVMANHYDPRVRAAVIRLLAVMCERLNKLTISQYTKAFYWYHLGNQISLHTADLCLIQACAQWITGSCLSLEKIAFTEEIKIVEKFGFSPLIALIPQTAHDTHLSKLTIKFMERIYQNVPEYRSYLVENGLLPAACKYLPKFYEKWASTNEASLKYIHSLYCTIGRFALLSSGMINILWDLINGLAFIETNKNKIIFRGIRVAQAIVLLELFEIFLPQNVGLLADDFKFSVSIFNSIDCQLSVAERKTRFDLLIDRIVQFITNVDPSHIPTDYEIKLIQNIVSLSVTGYQRGCNIIPWGLCPSRPITLKAYIIRMLWKHMKKGHLPNLGCDGKIVKALTQSFLETDGDIIPSSDLNALMTVCSSLGITSTTVCNISQTLEKLQFMRESSIRDQKPAIQRTVFKFESIVQSCIDTAMRITRDVVELQNMERRILMNGMRSYDESGLSLEWKLIIDRITNEGAPWHYPVTYANSWELDQTEGPSRVRVRLRRCRLNIDGKFFVSDVEEDLVKKNQPQPLSYLNETLVCRPNFALNDQVLYTFTCKHLPIDNEIDGEMIITESHLIFIANIIEHDPINIEIANIMEIWMRRYQHQENGLELFLQSNISKLFIFQNIADRTVLIQYFADKVVQCPDAPKLSILIQQWKEGQLSNWEYLMALNQISGRTYQDLMQYPIFPWILSDYESSSLDLNDAKVFRNLEKPIAVQSRESEAHFINNYECLGQALQASGNCQMAPYHFGSHYSNSGTVLHFLVRIPPFTKFFLRYQDDNFDLPDRTFHSMKTTWRLASKDSPTDVKELIPEFFYLPEIFENSECFNFGCRQSGEMVNHVTLPAWAAESNRMFILIHRQALESNIVRGKLHKWIDLIFGYKQTGPAAIEAINVFHPATYIGFSANGIIDPVEKIALETMVRTYGQMPRQLFNDPHPQCNKKDDTISNNVHIYPTIKGLRWGIYTGSPQLGEPKMCNFYQQFDIIFQNLITLNETNVLYGVPKGCNIMQGCDADTMNLILWNECDGIVRIKPFCDENIRPQPLVANIHIDEISACGTDPQSNQLWFGHKSGRITIYESFSTSQNRFNKSRFFQHSSSQNRMSYNSAFRKHSSKDSDKFQENNYDMKTIRWKMPIVLVRHTNEVTAIQISKEFKIVVSVAKDGLAVLWDSNRLQYIRTIHPICKTPISLVALSPTLGDIVTIHRLDETQQQTLNSDDDDDDDNETSDCFEATENVEDFVKIPINVIGKKTLMRLHTINAKYVNHITMSEKINAICYSSIKEGTGINVIATGIDDGIIRLWSSWDLTLIKEINVGKVNVISLKYSSYQHLIVLTGDNVIQVWESGGLQGNTPKFPQIVFHKRISV